MKGRAPGQRPPSVTELSVLIGEMDRVLRSIARIVDAVQESIAPAMDDAAISRKFLKAIRDLDGIPAEGDAIFQLLIGERERLGQALESIRLVIDEAGIVPRPGKPS